MKMSGRTKASKVMARAKKKFGTTKSCADAGFILHNGELLDLKAKDGLKWIHNSIAKIYGPKQKSPVARFMKDTKSIRFYPMQNTTHLEIQAENGVSREQERAIQRCVCQQSLSPRRIIYDIVHNEKIVKTGEVAENPYRDVPCHYLIKKFMSQIMEYGD